MEKIGRYVVAGEVGRGAMGVVYRAQDPAIRRTVAIKTIRLGELTDPGERTKLRDRLFREAQSAGILSHPGIVTIYDIAEDGDLAYIFMEFVNGPSLEKVMSKPEAPAPELIFNILRQTAGALDYAHRKGIVHRDIKPANIMIHEDGTAKVTDFGVAKIVSQNMTQAGTMMGTPSYMSPEQVQGKPVDGRADQFALAVIAYEMLTGEKPFIAEYLPALLFKIVAEQPAAPQRVNPSLAEETEPVLRRALAKLPDDRFPTCITFIDALRDACAAKPGWHALPAGTSPTLPTVSTTGSGSPAPVAAPVETVVVGPPMPPVPVPPARKPRRLDEDREPEPEPVYEPDEFEESVGTEPETAPSGRGRKLAIAAAVLVIAGVAAVGGRMFFAAQTETASAPPADAPQSQVPSINPQPPPSRPSPVDAPVETPPTTPAPPPRPPAPTEKIVEVSTNPQGAAIEFDSNPSLACISPCKMPLLPGRHTLVASLNGHHVERRIFELPKQSSVDLDLRVLTGVLLIESEPSGASVFIDGSEQSAKTPLSITLPVGKHRVVVAIEGSAKREFEIEVQDGPPKTIRAEFK